MSPRMKVMVVVASALPALMLGLAKWKQRWSPLWQGHGHHVQAELSMRMSEKWQRSYVVAWEKGRSELA